MEKLIELLNEYEKSKKNIDYKWEIESKTLDWIGGRKFTGMYVDDEEAERIIISKKYGFIKWLVDNDKIDISKIKCGYVYNDTEEDKVKNVIMNLSISDTPIEDLIGYLK